MNYNHHFGKYLGDLLQKYGIKGSELADALGVSRQYVSSIITNKKTPSRECFDALLTFLDKYLTPLEEQNLANKLIYAKTGIDSPFAQRAKPVYSTTKEINNDNISVDEQILLSLYRALIPKAQMEAINFLRQKEMEMIELQQKLVLESNETRAPYNELPQASEDKTAPSKDGKSDKS